MPYVIANPDRVDRLVLYGTSPRDRCRSMQPPAQVESMQVQLKTLELGWPQDMPGFGTFHSSLHIPDATPPRSLAPSTIFSVWRVRSAMRSRCYARS